MNMAKKVLVGAAFLVSTSAFANIQCEQPKKQDEKWKLFCSDDGKTYGITRCEWLLNIQLEGGDTTTVVVNTVAAQKKKNYAVWEDDRIDGRKILSATLAKQTCSN